MKGQSLVYLARHLCIDRKYGRGTIYESNQGRQNFLTYLSKHTATFQQSRTPSPNLQVLGIDHPSSYHRLLGSGCTTFLTVTVHPYLRCLGMLHPVFAVYLVFIWSRSKNTQSTPGWRFQGSLQASMAIVLERYISIYVTQAFQYQKNITTLIQTNMNV